MEDIEHSGVDEHDSRFKDPEEVFVRIDVSRIAQEELDDAVGTSNSDDDTTDVHDGKDTFDVLCEDLSFVDTPLKYSGKANKTDEQASLENERCLYQVFAHQPFCG